MEYPCALVRDRYQAPLFFSWHYLPYPALSSRALQSSEILFGKTMR
ncbi:unnamed protein product [Penicillium camemberti]|uniref:Str. FM013 n=1 Tax=Penicillium camemberti (strain FM 013) TaxID=1429867 RepID=A0A0G4NSI1_PENC3|nr:unnamed protein product [Penicillium camemberti]